MQYTSAPSFSSPILKVEGLIKIYGKRRVVDGVSFHVNPGEIVGLLGPNGAGKTTSFRMTCGLIDTNGGIVYLCGREVTNWPMYRRSREGGMGYLPQENSVFRNLSVQNNLLGVMEMLGVKRGARKKRCNELLEKFQLTHLRRNYAGGLSGGERRRLEIARALVSDPKIILLDEPFANIDPITVHNIQEIIRQLAQDGIAILITDHQVRETLQITERSYVIRSGNVLCHGTPAEVLSNPEARKVYFGEGVQISETTSSIIYPPKESEPPVPIREIPEPPKPVEPPPKPHHAKKPTVVPTPQVEERQPRSQAASKPVPPPSRPVAEPKRPAVRTPDYWDQEPENIATQSSAKRLVQTSSHELPSKGTRPLVQSKEPVTPPPPPPEEHPTTKSGLMRLFGWGK